MADVAAPPPAKATIATVNAHPVKGCKPITLERALLTSTGLPYDRDWMVCRESDGKFISQRERPKLTLVQPHIAAELFVSTSPPPADATMKLTAPGMEPLTVPLHADMSKLRLVSCWDWNGYTADQGDAAAKWFSDFLGEPCRLVRYIGNEAAAALKQSAPGVVTRTTEEGFAEGYETRLSDGYPILLANLSSLDDLNKRIAASENADTVELPLPIVRFRPNIVVQGLEAWAEDRYKKVTVNNTAELLSVKPCARCKVPTVNPDTAEYSAGEPSDTLWTFRKGSDLKYSVKSWKYAVHFGWNVVVPAAAVGTVISVGDPVEFSEAQKTW